MYKKAAEFEINEKALAKRRGFFLFRSTFTENIISEFIITKHQLSVSQLARSRKNSYKFSRSSKIN